MSFYEIVAILFVVVIMLVNALLKGWFRQESYKSYKATGSIWPELILKQQSKEGLETLSYVHSEHWDEIKDLIPWQTRSEWNQLRGNKESLVPIIYHFTKDAGLSPQIAQWIFEEYMITTKVEDLPPPENTWVCPHCGTANIKTAIFCKDCGEYK